ncbi:MAG TPA: DUF3467 domain-containing protein [Vicinamibacteria bacterium]|jgi:hypothetical protein|nr:DUF3467 domain-containing protein [Vicinamibacteria bacterium]
MEQKKSINFTVIPSEREPTERLYANFCAIAHTPFDFTLTFCEMIPISERDFKAAPDGSTHVVQAPVRAKIVVPVQLVPALTAALQENMRIYQESYSNVGWGKKPVH